MAVTRKFQANVIGLPQFSWIKQVNVRGGPGTNKELIFTVPVGTKNLDVLDVAIDSEGNSQGGKVFQWFKLTLPSGEGWVRDDLLSVAGDGGAFGYPKINQAIAAFNLKRGEPTTESGDGTGNGGTETVDDTPPIMQDDDTGETAPPAPDVDEPPAAGAPAKGTVMGSGGLSLRSQPTLSANLITRMSYRDTVDILDAAPGQDDSSFMWAKVNYKGTEGWARSDYLRLSGDFEQHGLGFNDRYPNPAPQSHWSRGWDPDGSRFNTGKHEGWDHSGTTGADLLAGPGGGYVVINKYCQRCGDNGISVKDAGYNVGDIRLFSDPSWNFGYGHYIIVRYDHDKLPASTKAELKEKGFEGAHIFVMYAHMHDTFVKTGDTLDPNQPIGTMGNSGNSTGTHLHLEVRAHSNADETNWWKMKPGLMTPEVLFLR